MRFTRVGLIPNTNARQHALQHCSSTELHLNWELSSNARSTTTCLALRTPITMCLKPQLFTAS